MNLPFKVCPTCGKMWWQREEFLQDAGVELVGYQVHFECLTLGLLLFNHQCGTTFGLTAGNFTDLYDGPIFTAPLTGTGECPGYCLRKDELRPCPAQCECASIREILGLLAGWPKLAA